MERIARVYADALFEAAKEAGKLDRIQTQLRQFAEALDQNRDLAVFFFSPYFSTAEKQEGLGRAVSGAEPEFINFLELLLEKHRMPVIFRICRRYDELVAEENKELEVTVTSAVTLDQDVTEQIGSEIEKQTGRKIELRNDVDEDILGGLVLRVGNMVLDASLRNRLDQLRKSVAAAA